MPEFERAFVRHGSLVIALSLRELRGLKYGASRRGAHERTMQDYEQLGAFYLGSGYDLIGRKRRSELVLYDSRHLTTHALCVGHDG